MLSSGHGSFYSSLKQAPVLRAPPASVTIAETLLQFHRDRPHVFGPLHHLFVAIYTEVDDFYEHWGMNVVHWAAMNLHTDTLASLIEWAQYKQGPDIVNSTDQIGRTPLYCVAAYQLRPGKIQTTAADKCAAIETLLKLGADPNKVTTYGDSPLAAYTRYYKNDCARTGLRLLLSAGARMFIPATVAQEPFFYLRIFSPNYWYTPTLYDYVRRSNPDAYTVFRQQHKWLTLVAIFRRERKFPAECEARVRAYLI